MSRFAGENYKTYRITATATVDIEVPPHVGVGERYQYAADKAEDFLYAQAPDVDWEIGDMDDVTREEV